MKKLVIALTMAAILSGCSAKDKRSVLSEKEEIAATVTSAESTSATEATTAPESEATSEAEQDSDFQILKVEDDGITVLVHDTIQKIEIDCSQLFEFAERYHENPEYFLAIDDFNFDGYDDLFVPRGAGVPNIMGTYFYMNPTANFNPFEEWDELNEIGFLMKADSEKKILNFSSRISAIDHDWIIYKWKAGKLHPVSREYQYQSVYDNQVYINCFEYDDDGKETLAKIKRALLGENKEWLGTEEVELPNRYTYSVNENSVDVLLEGKIIQTLECDYTPDDKLFFEDYDFDGCNDLFFMMKNGAMYSNGAYFRYVPDTGLFEKWDELNKIGRGMIVNAENSTLREKKHSDDYWLEYFDYKWEDSKLVLFEHRVSETGEIMEIYSVDSDGNEKLIGTEVK